MYRHRDGGYKAINVTRVSDMPPDYVVEWIAYPGEHPLNMRLSESGTGREHAHDVIARWINEGYWLRQWPSCVTLPDGI